MEVDCLPPPEVTLLFFKVSNMASASCLDKRLASVFRDLLGYSQSRLICWKIDLISWKKNQNQNLDCCKEIVHRCLTCSSCPAQAKPL